MILLRTLLLCCVVRLYVRCMVSLHNTLLTAIQQHNRITTIVVFVHVIIESAVRWIKFRISFLLYLKFIGQRPSNTFLMKKQNKTWLAIEHKQTSIAL